MNLIAKISSVFLKANLLRAKDIRTGKIKLRRDIEVFGQESLSRQRLFEKWARKDTWLLQTEAIPLLLGIDPKEQFAVDKPWSDEFSKISRHAEQCAINKRLSVMNFEKPLDAWRVKPVDLYHWAMISRLPVPDELSRLMDFILQTVKCVDASQKKGKTADKYDNDQYRKHREIVLGAAVSLLANAYKQCINSEGNITSKRIARHIFDKKEHWFFDEKPIMSVSVMAELIDSYIQSGQLSTH